MAAAALVVALHAMLYTSSAAEPQPIAPKDPARRDASSVAPPPAASSTAIVPAPLTLVSGEVRVLELPGLRRIALGSGRVVTARVVEERQLVLMAEAAGTTQLVAWLRSGPPITLEIVVQSSNPARATEELRRMLAHEEGLQIQAVGSRTVIEGRYANEEARARIAAALKPYSQVVNLISPPLRTQSRLTPEPMIHLDVKVFEVRKSALERLGVRWNADGMRGPTAATSGYAYANTPFRGTNPGGFPATTAASPWVSYLGLATEITSVIDLLEQAGDGWTLAEPRLSCKSGGEARFVVGGEIPIPVTNGTGHVSVVYKQYGVIVEFRPVVDEDGNIASKIVTEVSEPDPRNSNQGFIAFAQNRTETEFFLHQDETLVISGLLKNSGAKAATGIPGLGRLPVLGRLFRSDEFRNERTELIVMVTPRIVAAAAAANLEAVGRAGAIAAQSQARIARRLAE
jgi:pilus assembly protein CpaC